MAGAPSVAWINHLNHHRVVMYIPLKWGVNEKHVYLTKCLRRYLSHTPNELASSNLFIATSIALVSSKPDLLPRPLFSARRRRPADLDRLNSPFAVPEPEMQFGIALGEVAVSASHLCHFAAFAPRL